MQQDKSWRRGFLKVTNIVTLVNSQDIKCIQSEI
jgi:hypothetical protein